MAVDQKIHALESMLRLIDKDPDGMGEIFKRTVRPTLEDAKKKRNGIVHHFWTGHNGIVHRSTIQARGKLHVVSTKVDIHELVEVSQNWFRKVEPRFKNSVSRGLYRQ